MRVRVRVKVRGREVEYMTGEFDFGLENCGAYQKALVRFDDVFKDVEKWLPDPVCRRLAAQQLASADSIGANIEEGYGRLSSREYAQFLVYARGSAQETRGRYRRLRHWIPRETVDARVQVASEIIGILTTSIKTLRSKRR